MQKHLKCYDKLKIYTRLKNVWGNVPFVIVTNQERPRLSSFIAKHRNGPVDTSSYAFLNNLPSLVIYPHFPVGFPIS